MPFLYRTQKVIKTNVDKATPATIVHQTFKLFFANEPTLGFGIITLVL
jgi:hypothetical protein